eukprot:jgi/Chlat1/60/Chrsp1S03112
MLSSSPPARAGAGVWMPSATATRLSVDLQHRSAPVHVPLPRTHSPLPAVRAPSPSPSYPHSHGHSHGHSHSHSQSSSHNSSSSSSLNTSPVPSAVGFKVQTNAALPPVSRSRAPAREGLLGKALSQGLSSYPSSSPPCPDGFPYVMAFTGQRTSRGGTRDYLADAQSQLAIFNDPLVVKAYRLAETAHAGQTRKNGDPYIVHCVETARILADLRANAAIVSAAILHDVIDDTSMELSDIKDACGDEVAKLVELVSQMSTICDFVRHRTDKLTPETLKDLKKVFTNMGSGAGVNAFVIKLADRLHNMRTLEALEPHKQQRMAQETLEVFAPLANRLGMWHLKAELEDLCFMYLKSEECRALKAQLASLDMGRTTIGDSMRTLQRVLNDQGVRADIYGRPKNLYSIYRKMADKGKTLDDIYDLHAIRIVVNDVRECYDVLTAVHTQWEHLPDRFKDYIKEPKESGYKSLHTVVKVGAVRMEVQIRTQQMHLCAEYGVAAHWQYKEGDDDVDEVLRRQVRWMRYMLSWSREAQDNIAQLEENISAGNSPATDPELQRATVSSGLCDFPTHREECRYHKLAISSEVSKVTDLSIFGVDLSAPDNGGILVIMADGNLVELPPCATASDIARREGYTGRGFLSSLAPPVVQVNGRPVELDHPLRPGDLIQVVAEPPPRPPPFLRSPRVLHNMTRDTLHPALEVYGVCQG